MSAQKASLQTLDKTSFVWSVSDKGYVWDPEANVAPGLDKSRRSRRQDEIFLVEVPESSGYIMKKPLEDEPTLFFKFADLTISQEETADFANSHGWLGGLNEKILVTRPGIQDLVEGEPFGLWKTEISEAKALVTAWEMLSQTDKEGLSEIIRWENKLRVFYILEGSRRLLASGDRSPEIFARFRPGDVLLPAKYLIQRKINEKLEKYSVRPRLLMDDKNNLVSYQIPESLLAAMWLQFFRVAAGEREFKRCSVCGLWADVTERNKNWTRHPECGARERVSRYRKRKLDSSDKEGK